jgi:hypothetical protein
MNVKPWLCPANRSLQKANKRQWDMTNWRYKIGINLMKIIVADIVCKVNLILQLSNTAIYC